MVQHITTQNFKNEVWEADRPVLVDFWAPWCGPCKMLSPIIEQIAQQRDDIKVAKVNIEEEPQLAARYNVISIPTLAVMKEGKVANLSVGVVPKAQILSML